jgi:hypothetical protein
VRSAAEGEGERRPAGRPSQNRSPPLNQLEDEHDYGKNEQDVNKPA